MAQSSPTSTRTSEHVYLAPGARYFIAGRYDKKKDEVVFSSVKDIWANNRLTMVVESGATLWDFFNCLMNSFVGFKGAEELIKYTQCDFTLLAEDIRKSTNAPDKDLDFLEVFPIVELHKYKREKPRLSHYWGFHGWGTWPAENGVKKGTKGGWAIELTPLAELKNVELKIRTETELWDEKWKPKYDRKLITKFRMEPTLLEFIHAILWELSFFGSPAERDKQSAGLKTTMDEIDSGKVKTVPLDSLRKRLDAILDD